MSRKPLHTLRQRIQANLNGTAPTNVMRGTAFEADERYQNAGEKGTPPRDPADPPRRRATKRKGHSTSANDRPPISSSISRETSAQRFWGATTPTDGRVMSASWQTSRLAIHGWIPMSGRATGGVTPPMPRSPRRPRMGPR